MLPCSPLRPLAKANMCVFFLFEYRRGRYSLRRVHDVACRDIAPDGDSDFALGSGAEPFKELVSGEKPKFVTGGPSFFIGFKLYGPASGRVASLFPVRVMRWVDFVCSA